MPWNFNEEMDSIDICPTSAILEYLRYEGISGDCLVQTTWSEQGQLKYIFGCIFLWNWSGLWSFYASFTVEKPFGAQQAVCLCTAPQAAM